MKFSGSDCLKGYKPSVYYPEYIAKVNNFFRNGENVPGIQNCSRSFIGGKCGSGHNFYKQLVCGKEYCKECGQDDSIVHQRRKARWWPKLFSMEKVGYLVITIPYQVRNEFKDVTNLKLIRKAITTKLKDMGYNKGLMRWHWYGDCKDCKNKDPKKVNCNRCQGTGAGDEFNPHLNFFIESGFLFGEKFNNFRNTLMNFTLKWFKNNLNYTGDLKGNIHYKYCGNEGQKGHKLNYVTRSTFKIYDSEIAKILKGFKTTNQWGKFDLCKTETTNEPLILIESGRCPCCKLPIAWKGGKDNLIKKTEIIMMKKLSLPGGYLMGFSDLNVKLQR